ncbi:hypothetical protein SAMD00019534_121430 [Acytostelium subglobosum LB1]|uniref:hypothetical protein n=1 Tax=Acytostelium subglobosum LB1 TaxID=1410327 RepID=UPI000644B1F1|nr:hypothetical protein SAMD00019534_121430 [Acytostelium subglobosum LB1]GAM28967.1 hypothetical protein SAMD00019534_121430 [Acytostelium subglobosum LB1]|eukprot:XP_012748152.1 hypothetical protein SAMD00019534_121430 [Acytostelium subglobosum LB1]
MTDPVTKAIEAINRSSLTPEKKKCINFLEDNENKAPFIVNAVATAPSEDDPDPLAAYLNKLINTPAAPKGSQQLAVNQKLWIRYNNEEQLVTVEDDETFNALRLRKTHRYSTEIY